MGPIYRHIFDPQAINLTRCCGDIFLEEHGKVLMTSNELPGNSNFAKPERKLCIVTPDSLYRGLLSAFSFPNFSTRIISGGGQFESLIGNFEPDAFLLFSDHLGPGGFAKTLLQIRANHSNASVFQLDNLRNPKLRAVPAIDDETVKRAKVFNIRSLEDLDRAIGRALDHNLKHALSTTGVTKRQMEILELVAAGYSNPEIAIMRGTTLRAAETIVQRALLRIGASENTSSRAQVVVAQKYLASLNARNIVVTDSQLAVALHQIIS